jgi:superfamily I DNA/RNA helicase
VAFAGNFSLHQTFLREAALHPEKLSPIDYAFIDEVQDLAPCDLAAVKHLTRRAVVLAGDADQSLYRSGFGFRRAGIDISGRTKILHTNYRNTAQIHELAERYRATIPGQDGENAPEAFRVGPPPELIEAKSESELRDLLCARIGLFTGHLGYEIGNIAVLTPREAELQELERLFAERAIGAKNIKADDFDFADTRSLRLSTLHSAKGLDFPVVLLYLPRMLPPDPTWENALAERLHRSLIYVAMTRALDQLSVFCLEGATSRSIVALKGCFRAMEKEGKKDE